MQTYIIEVPQHCYGIITQNTPPNITGLLTTGVQVCCGITIYAAGMGCCFLYHADSTTDLRDPQNGIEALLALIPRDCEIQITYDDSTAAADTHVAEIIEELRGKGVNILDPLIIPRESQGVDLLLHRNGKIDRGGSIAIHIENPDPGEEVDPNKPIIDYADEYIHGEHSKTGGIEVLRGVSGKVLFRLT